MSQFDLYTFLQSTFDDIEHEMKVRLSPEARQALVAPAIAHEATVISELETGEITVSVLREKVAAQVAIAMKIAAERTKGYKRGSLAKSTPIITADDASDSMEKNCQFLFWC